jgi:hypothetical protein
MLLHQRYPQDVNVGIFAIILVREFSLFWLLKPTSRELAEEECPLISRVITKKSTA